jgi:hypothetical protein
MSNSFFNLRILSMAFLLQLTGCAVIHFENGEVVPDPFEENVFGDFFVSDEEKLDPGKSYRYAKWYHHSFYQVAEINDPLDLSRVCTGLDWNKITTDTSPLKVLVGLLDNAILIPASSAGIDLWSAWGIEYSCRYQ